MRRLIVACDGTGKSSARGEYSVSTNINRLCHALDMDGEVQQIVLYQSGIGTANYGFSIQNMVQMTGMGLDDMILDGYQFIANNYLPGDEIFLFGFSRGAYAARILANFIVKLGLLRTNYSWELKKVWNAYTEGKFDEGIKATEQRSLDNDPPDQKRRQRVNVKVCGCFDTVGSVKGGEFYDPSLVTSPDSEGKTYRIENAFHALALDEYRRLFSPTLWYKTPGNEGTNLEQVWFSGAHTNVGGGYSDQICADMAFLWMIDHCSPFLAFDPGYLKERVIYLDHHPETIVSAEKQKKKKDNSHPVRPYYVDWGLGLIEDSYHNGMQRLQGWKIRHPMEYGSSPGDVDNLSVQTNEKIHPSVRSRWNNPTKEAVPIPDALKGFTPHESDGKWKWVRPAVAASWLSWTYASPKVEIEEEEFTVNKNKWEWILRHGRKEGSSSYL